MNLIQIAALLMRIYGVYLFLDAFIVLTELPTSIYGMLNGPGGYLTTQREIILVAEIFRLFFYCGLGLAFLLFSRPIGKILIKGLANLKEDGTV